MRYVLAFCAFLLMVLAAAEIKSNAAPLCGEYKKMLRLLEKQYLEIPKFRALSNTGKIMRVVTVSPHGSFTLLVVSPNMKACVATLGRDWHPIPPKSF